MTAEDLKKMPPLSLPIADLRLAKDSEGNLKVMDRLRKKFVSLTPEEFVRQNFVEWLINSLHFPESLMANEVEIKLYSTRKRCDTIIFDSNLTPQIIVEYKAPGVEITQDVFDQIVRYNRELKAKYLVVTNGRRHYCCKLDYERDTYNFIKTIPTYEEIKGLPGVN